MIAEAERMRDQDNDDDDDQVVGKGTALGKCNGFIMYKYKNLGL